MRATYEGAPHPSLASRPLDISPRRLSSAFVLAISSGIAAVLALTVAAQTYLSMLTHGHSFLRIAGWQLASWSLWAIAAPIVLRAGAALPTGHDQRRRRYLRTLGLGLVLIGAHAILTAQFTVWIQPFEPVRTHHFADSLLDQLGVLLVVDLVAYAIVLVIGGTLAVYDRARQLELRESRLEAQLARANLEALRLEIQPHFLFNTLNTIGALIRRQAPGRALEMLVGLSDLMRGTLERRHAHVTTLEDEMAFVRKYVDLYRVRFSDRLEVTYDVDPATLTQEVPTFILQPLVENAFRHGLSRRFEGSRVEIGARFERDCLSLWVADDGVGVPADFMVTENAGTGLSNVRARVEGLFGPTARVDVRPRGTGGTIASIVLPLASVRPAQLAAS
jgi:two-component system, LytTR family, sensor kinase